MYKTTQQRQQAKAKTRKTKSFKHDQQISLWEQPISFDPSQVYFKKLDDVILKIEGTSQKGDEFLLKILQPLTQNTNLISESIKFINSGFNFKTKIDDFSDIIFLLQAVQLLKGGKILYIGDLKSPIFREKISCLTTADVNSFGLDSQFSAIFTSKPLKTASQQLFAEPENEFFYSKISTFHIVEKYKFISNYILNFHSQIVIIFTLNQEFLMNRMIQRNLTTRQLSRIEFMDRPYNSQFEQVLLVTDFFFSKVLERPFLSSVKYCLQKSDFLNAINQLYLNLVLPGDIGKILGQNLSKLNKFQLEMVQNLLEENQLDSRVIYARYKAFPTNEQIKLNGSLLAIRNKTFKYHEFDIQEIQNQGIQVFGEGGLVFLNTSLKLSQAQITLGILNFYKRQISILMKEFKFVFGDEPLPSFPSKTNAQFRLDLDDICEEKTIYGDFCSKINQISLLNAELHEDLGYLLVKFLDSDELEFVIQIIKLIENQVYKL